MLGMPLALCSPATPQPSPDAFQDVDMTVVRTLKRKTQERQVRGKRWGVGAGAEVGSVPLRG